MALLGDRVGSAYVKIFADGRGMDKEIAKQLKKVDGKKAGEEIAGEFDAGLTKKMERDRPGVKTMEGLFQKQAARMNFFGELSGTNWFKAFEKNLQKSFGEQRGSRIAELINRDIAEGLDFGVVFKKLKSENAKAREFELANLNKYLKQVLKEEEEGLSERIKIFNREREAKQRQYFQQEADHRASLIRQAKDLLKAHEEAIRMDREFNRARDFERDQDFERHVRNHQRIEDERDGHLGRLLRKQLVFSRRFGAISDGIGAAFGRGSRNNFLNFIGSLVRNGVRAFLFLGDVVGGTVRILKNFLVGVSEIAVAMASAAKNASTLGGAIVASVGAGAAQAGASFAGFIALVSNPAGWVALIAGAVAAALALTALALVIGPLVALLFSLAGALIAVGAALIGGLAGGLGIVAALLFPLILGVGGLAGAIASLDDASKKALKNSIQPLVAEFKALGKNLASNAFATLSEDIAELKTAFDTNTVKKFATAVGAALNQVREGFVDLVASPGFQNFVKDISDTIPGQLIQMGEVGENITRGLGGFFVAMGEPIDRFLNRLISVTDRFANFANSQGGQSAIADFFNQAERALASIGTLLVDTGALFANLFRGPAGDSGISLLDSLSGKIRDLVKYLKANPDKVKEFFEGAEDIARTVGDAIVDITVALGKLNTPENRELAQKIFGALVLAIEFGVIAIDNFRHSVGFLVDALTGDLAGAFRHMVGQVAAFIEFANKVPGVEKIVPDSLITKMKDFANNTKTGGNSLRVFGQASKSAAIEAELLKTKIISIGNTKAAVDVDSKTITVADEKTAELARKLHPNYKVKVSKDDLVAIIEKQKELQSRLDAIKKGAKVPVTSSGIPSTISQLQNLYQALRNIQGVKLQGGVLSVRGQTVNARGGILDALGNVQRFQKFAVGGFANFAQMIGNNLVGESGREAIVPMSRPLGQVDPSVRWLSAIAQGKVPMGGGQTLDFSGMTIMTPTEDPAAVAQEVMNQITGSLL